MSAVNKPMFLSGGEDSSDRTADQNHHQVYLPIGIETPTNFPFCNAGPVLGTKFPKIIPIAIARKIQTARKRSRIPNFLNAETCRSVFSSSGPCVPTDGWISGEAFPTSRSGVGFVSPWYPSASFSSVITGPAMPVMMSGVEQIFLVPYKYLSFPLRVNKVGR